MPEVTTSKGTQGFEKPPKTGNEEQDIVNLYEAIEASGGAREAAAVPAEEIRKYIQAVFDAGRDKVSIAKIVQVINLDKGLEGKDRIQNSSVRSAALRIGDLVTDEADGFTYVIKKKAGGSPS